MQTISTWVLAGIIVLALGPLASAQTVASPADALDVVNVAFSSTVSFTVVSKSAKPILAWGLQVTATFTDGSTKSTHVSTDLTATLPLVGRAQASPGSYIGELNSGARSPDRRVGLPRRGNEQPASVTITPEFVIFSDNSVVGDEAAASAIFERRKAARDAYAEYLPLVRRLRDSTDKGADLAKLADQMKRARSGENVFGRPASQHSKLGLLYDQFAIELNGVQRCTGTLKLQKQDEQTCFSDYTQMVQSYYEVFSAHAERAGGVK